MMVSDLKQMLLYLPKLQEQEARLKANPQLTYAELGGEQASSLRFAIHSDNDGFNPAEYMAAQRSTNHLADAQRELEKQMTWIEERVNFILGLRSEEHT